MLTAHWKYSGSCNLSCKFCYGLSENLLKRKIDEYSIIDKLIDAGFTHLCFGGDEPLLRKKELLPLILYAVSKGLKCSLDTNGINLDNKTLAYLKKQDILLGLPLYSGNPKIHDSMVEKSGHYDQVLSLLEKAKNYSIPTRVQTAVTKANANNIERIGCLVKKYNVLYWNIIKFKPYGRALQYKKNYYISEELFNMIAEKIKKRHKSINIVFRGGDDDAKCGYFIIRRDGFVVCPVENGREIILGDLTKENAKEIAERLNKLDNSRKTEIESIKYSGKIC